MAIVSRPVLGTTTQCLSNVLSGNLSDPNRGSDQCLKGLSPTAWRDSSNYYWPISQNTQYSSKFGGSDGRKFIKILRNNPGSNKSTFIAAYLNAQYDSRYTLSPQEVIALENDNNYYNPQIIDAVSFLRSTWW